MNAWRLLSLSSATFSHESTKATLCLKDTNMDSKFDWKPEYKDLTTQFLKVHFGGWQGLTNCFPCMRVHYKWGNHRPDVIDSRVPAKNNTEYHGLEKHATQYFATAQYEYAYHHWLLAAHCRKDDMEANNFQDEGHIDAIRYCIKQALYCRALDEWQKNKQKRTVLPNPEDFSLSVQDIDQKEQKALQQIDDYSHEKK